MKNLKSVTICLTISFSFNLSLLLAIFLLNPPAILLTSHFVSRLFIITFFPRFDGSDIESFVSFFELLLEICPLAANQL